MKEVVKLPINTPVEVTLQFEDGKRVEGRYGDQVMYSLTDNRVMYVPLYVEQRLQELAIGAGEPLLLCKKVVKDGSRNRTEWSVRRAPQPPLAPANGTSAMDSVAPDATLDLRPLGPTDDSEIAARSEGETSDGHQTIALVPEKGSERQPEAERQRRGAFESSRGAVEGPPQSSADRGPHRRSPVFGQWRVPHLASV